MAGGAEGLQRAASVLEQKREVVLANVKELKGLRDSFAETDEILSSLGSKLRHEVVIPFCGSSKILAHAQILHTNEVYVQNGESRFVHRTIEAAAKSNRERIALADTMVADMRAELNSLASRQTFSPALLADITEADVTGADAEPSSNSGKPEAKREPEAKADARLRTSEAAKNHEEPETLPQPQGEPQRQSQAQAQPLAKGSIRKTAEGYLEIVERF